MPLYEYRCRCEKKVDAVQGMEQEHKYKCPDCGKPMQRIFDNTKFHFSGHPRSYDPLRGITDAEYDRHAFKRQAELSGKRIGADGI